MQCGNRTGEGLGDRLIEEEDKGVKYGQRVISLN